MIICPVCEAIYPPNSYERCPQDGAPLYVFGEGEVRKRFVPGEVIVKGKYEIIEEIARRGGAGRTFRARQVNLDREVELRLLPDDSLTKPGDHARFQREVSTWGKLRSDHLVRLYDSGFTEENAPYMALEYVAGGTLGQRLRIAGPLRESLLRTVTEQALMALDAAHTAGVLHRDLSPDALVLGRRGDGQVYCRLTGFGLAKIMGDLDDDPTAITMTGQVIGNPAYMAPEQIMLGTLEPRTDLYSLGVTLYELASGERPFPGSNLAELLAMHVRETPVPLHARRPDLDLGLRTVIDMLVAKNADDRYPSAREALAALRDQYVAFDPSEFTAPTAPTAWEPPKRRTQAWVPWAIGAGLMVLGVALGLWLS
ncbi:MAG: serine/threonine protein kinase [Bradymonadia bacterium]|jgi:serine/threonine protein kinase